MRSLFSKKIPEKDSSASETKPAPVPVKDSIEDKKSETGELNKYEQLQKQLNNLFLVNELSRQITSSLSIDENFAHLYQTINSMMDASVVELVVYGEDGKRLFFSNKKYTGSDIQLTSYNHISEWCYANNKEVILEDASNDFGRYVNKALTLPDGKAAQSLMCFPVQHLDKTIGTLCIVSFAKNVFELFHKEMIQLLLPFVGVAINNAFTHQQIIDLKHRAERSEQFMQVFLANMSHEIRTPMNAVMGMTNLLLQKNPMPEQLKYLNTIQKSSDNLLVILNDILDLSKIEAGKIEIENIDFAVTDVINNVREIIQFKSEEKGLTLITSVDSSIPPVLTGDPTRLAQILLNLLGNSVKFTDSGSVKLSVNMIENSDPNFVPVANGTRALNFSISDTGIGMTEEQQAKLFQNYAQASTETTRKYGGTGLGLSISQQLVQLQGGTIEAKSTPGKGSTFSFSLAYTVSPNKSIALKEKNISEAMMDELSGLRILLADDNEYNRIVVRETLELQIKNVQVDEAHDGILALQMLQRSDYDVLIMDLVMPNMNGLEATQKIRSGFSDMKKSIPIIAITASVLKSEIDKCYAAGMNGFIPKPFKPSEMIAVIYNVLFDDAKFSAPEIVTAPPKTEGIIDHNFVNEMSEGDTERIKRYAELFISKLPQTIAEIKAAVLNKDLEKIRIEAHSMKSILKFNGVLGGFQLAETIEENCSMQTNIEQLPLLIEELSLVCAKALEEIKAVADGI